MDENHINDFRTYSTLMCTYIIGRHQLLVNSIMIQREQMYAKYKNRLLFRVKTRVVQTK